MTVRASILLAFIFIIGTFQSAQAGPVAERIRERIRERIQEKIEEKTKPPTSQDPVKSINVNGVERQYLLHLPPSYGRSSGKLPLVLFFHGGKSKAEGMDRLTGFNAEADENNFVIVYPKGIDERWNDGRGSELATADDVGFVRALIDQLVQNDRIDPARVYATGISNGAILSHCLACELSDKITAIASVAGTLPTNVAQNCRPSRPIAVLMIHGTKDPLILWEGGTGNKKGQIGGSTLSVTETIQFWASKNGCGTIPQSTPVTDSMDDGTTTMREEYCPNAILYKVIEGGHTWPGGRQYKPETIIGKTSRDFEATKLIWEFFDGLEK